MTKKIFFEYILIFLVIFSPLFYGSLAPLPLSIIQFTSFILLVLWLLKLFFTQPCKINYPSSLPFMILFFSIAVFQLLPLPPSLLKIISPKTFFLYQEYLPNFSSSHFYPLTIYAQATMKEIIKLLSFFIIFLITLNVVEERGQFKKIFLSIIFWALILSFYGLIRKYFVLEKEFTYSFSTFGSKNHFAAYMVMVAPLTIGYALSYRDRTKRFLLGFAAALICASVFLSLSRAGSLSLTFSLLLMAFLLRKERAIIERYWVIGLAVVFGIIFILIAGFRPIKEAFLVFGQAWSGRLDIVRDSINIVKDFPLFGVGWGNFQYIFTLYRKFLTHFYYIHLHNDHLQLIIEMGLIASFFYYLFLFKVLREILTEFRKRRDPFVKSLAVGGWCGLLGVLFHSFFDFNFHIPAVIFLFWLILGLIYKCVYTHFADENEEL